MSNQTEILDREETAQVAQASSTEISISLDKVRGEIAAFDKINAGLAQLRKAHPADLVVDAATPAGMKLAIAARAAWRDPRVALERARKSAKAPVLELGREIDKFAASIEEQLRIGEANYDEQIKVETERKAREKKEAEEREADRKAQIQAKIAFQFSTVPMRATGKTAAQIADALRKVETALIGEPEYAEFVQDAIQAQQTAMVELQGMQSRMFAAEQEAERQRTQAEENRRKQEELRKQQADFEESQRAHREQVARELAERQAKEEAERRERAAELAVIQKAKDDLAAAQREEADRLAAIERKRLDDEAAERRRIADEKHRAEMQRKRDEQAAEEREAAKKLAAAQKAAKKAQKLAAMSADFLNLLQLIVAVIDKDGIADATTLQALGVRQLIAKAEAE